MKRIIRLILILSVLYVLFSMVDISKNYTTEQLSEIYGVDFDSYSYIKFHDISLLTHKKIYYHISSVEEIDGVQWTTNIYVADKEDYLPHTPEEFVGDKTIQINQNEYRIQMDFYDSRYNTECTIQKENCYIMIVFSGPSTIDFRYTDSTREIMYDITENIIGNIANKYDEK